ncbi:hypothetical protein RND81_04G103000 [Saponaria officinalis]|uniref:Acyl-[acyl-carrier-protein] hydrolase n=1 Tax=Saponaria officinalis TaxID=3572 RepID=A0AAW1LJW1_SAPOF
MMLKIQSLTQCGLWVPPKFHPKIENRQNVSIVRTSKRQDLSMPVTIKEVNNNGVTPVSRNLADKLRLGSMCEDGLSYKESYIIRSYEVGVNKTATIETIANLMQEVGCNHAQGVGFSTDGFATTPTMRELHLIWVTARMHIEIYRYPAWSDVLEIETWCQAEGKIGTRRDFIMKDYANGEVIGRATSKWVMMNMDTRKLERVSPQVAEEYLVFCPREPRLSFPEPNNKSLRKIPKLADPGHYSKSGLVPRRADLDMNQHVNNVTYIGWLLESTPQEIIDTHELRSITLDYRRECQQDDVVDSLTTLEATNGTESISQLNGTNGAPAGAKNEDESVQFLHLLRLSKDGSEINRGRTEWVRKPLS